MFALLSKRKYFEHFMGTWGGGRGQREASSKRNSLQGESCQENPRAGARRVLLRAWPRMEPKGTQESGQTMGGCAWGKGPLGPPGPLWMMGSAAPFPGHPSRPPSCCCCCRRLCPPGSPRNPELPTHSCWGKILHHLVVSLTQPLRGRGSPFSIPLFTHLFISSHWFIH